VRTAGPARSRPQAARPAARPGAAAKAGQPWTSKQARLALLYNEQGLRPAEIAQKLGLSSYAVTQIILNARNRGKL
jgi:DNA-binding transcriptional regulator LsrR (DeoR family)